MQFNVRNKFQQVLFEHEIKGQLSDGAWENSKPYDHWKIWCDAKVIVNPDKLGKNEWVERDRYDLVGQLYRHKTVQTRMLKMCRLVAAGYSADKAHTYISYLFNDLNDDCEFLGLTTLQKYADTYKGTYLTTLEECKSLNLTEIETAAENNDLYTLSNLRQDLADLNHIMKQTWW